MLYKRVTRQTGGRKSMHTPHWILRGAAALCAAAAVAGAAPAQTLEEALAQAYAANPRLLAERAALRAADENVAREGAAWRPTLEVTGNAGMRWERRESTFSFGDNDIEQRLKRLESGETEPPPPSERSGNGAAPFGWEGTSPISAGIDLSQPLYPIGATVSARRAAEERVFAARASLVDVEQQVLADTASAYVTVVRDQSVIELNVNNEQVLERQLQAARDRFHVGEITRTDVSQAEARLADARASRIGAEGNLEAARASYENLVGAAPGTLRFPDTAGFPVPASAEEAGTLAMARNPAIVRAAALENAAQHDIDLALARLKPRVTLEAALRRGWDPSPFSTLTDTAEVIARVTVPLYQTGEEYARVRQLREVAVQRRRELDAARRQARESVAQRWQGLETARARVEAFQASVEANGIALEGVEREAEVGARTVLDVLDAEQELFEAQVNLVRAEADAAAAAFALLRVTGRMTASELALPGAIYDPVAHYDAVRDKWIGLGGED